MNPICFVDNKEGNEVKSAEGLLTSDVSGMEEDDELGEPEVVPRVGDEYQAELPPFTAEPYFSQLVKRKGDSEIAENMSDSFLYMLATFFEVVLLEVALGDANN
ncbi:hypothetical protein TSUD_341840 [Trifolium subterraneum]|nr:hypothetical protein TSUD_341840 [Trifolium subterraneum]